MRFYDIKALASAAPSKDVVLTDSSQQDAQTSVVMALSHSNDYLIVQHLPNYTDEQPVSFITQNHYPVMGKGGNLNHHY